ncbi:26S proteasome regulatory subunit [Allomyces javanicus]|nr:26S proteasome regulatory subunit [Allomyces javanicus]
MSSMQVDLNPQAHIRAVRQQAQAEGNAALVETFNRLEDYYDRKLWHQLTVELDRFLALPGSGPYLIGLYENFVRDFETKLNKLTLVAGIGDAAAKQLPDNESRITFLLSLAERVAPVPPKKGEEHLHRVDLEATSAHLLAQTSAAYYQLLSGHYTTVYAHIAASEKLLDSLDGVDSRVSSAFYRVAADYYKAKLQYAKFYKTSLLFLGCLGDVNELPLDEAVERAHDLSLAALLSDEIYNFGELLMHQILEKLDNSPHAWLKALLLAFNSGDIAAFERASKPFPADILNQNMPFLQQKICLMALIDYVFTRTANERTLPFAAIAQHTRLPVHEVEHLLMKAMALDLIRGAIDQVDGTVTVTWVTPRVLDRTQIQGMAGMLDAWQAKVQQLAAKFEEDGAELFATA